MDKIPENYMLCDGRALNIDEYPELFENIGTSFGAVGTTQFKIPDLREKFLVGYSGNGDYNAVGQTGGLDEVTLTKERRE
ncbi:phage tail protein [Flavivirga aquimarina]|uniref:Phage tail protein n=1 Tax=Flavivirga aquimarina TaxID=2027862 RepID=A0ABT8WC36_9FLAO|nr:phage tail protein [Flavivirga aquimarina]MDO5970613.1 phage tail protein [Flavivirga aquimarina]